MKKILFVCALIVSASFVSCDNCFIKEATTVDTVCVDTLVKDTL